MGLTDDVRAHCAEIAASARSVTIDHAALDAFHAVPEARIDPEIHYLEGAPEDVARYMLTLDAINFGSGWFPTLRKRPGLSGYGTIAAGLAERFDAAGPWTAAELAELDAAVLARVLGQDPGHELIALYAASLRDLGDRVTGEYGGHFAAVADAAAGSATRLALLLGGWRCFADHSRYDELDIPFLKRAQIAAADLQRVGAAELRDLERLTMFADNLVPHVLRLDGVLRFSEELIARIEREELIEHGSREEIEIRACAVHAVALLANLLLVIDHHRSKERGRDVRPDPSAACGQQRADRF